ncbi:hypothetical protein EW146_g5542 [Bondarzewia mesenterica]|uniref:VHS domain-containing protein n=1 Tax=Bondarzewia mesenterica TaxID=1095465 RepID=A0A4S4LWY3_9AGAM|nr:hypothetical protein EW146_g5542 [Bondarzewia mesenterica]
MWSTSTPGNWMNASPLEMLITRATAASLPEPNYALHLEVAEYINQKKANTPREAAMLLARLVNHRNPHIAILSLALLDTLAQNCGYPFHLQISTKEFLNELVRRFPERPPPFPGPVMSRILELINTWKEGICAESRWKEDLGNIRDMHRLLTFKGYRFRELPRAAPSAAATSNLKSAEELESEDRDAQSAKLQELIRRGTPRDLAAAQDLMKSLAGANPDAKPDYRTQALNELNKLEQKVILLNEILDNVDMAKGEQFVKGDVYDQVASILVTSRPKIQKWISDAESDDPQSLDTYLQINDQINTVLERYEAYKKGDYVTASNPIPSELGPGRNDLSLIDFDDSRPSGIASKSQTGAPGTVADDLANLFGPSTSTQASAPTPAQPPNKPDFSSILAGFNKPNPSYFSPPHATMAPISPQFSNSTSRPGSAPSGQIMLPGTPTPPAQHQGIGTGIGMGGVGSPSYMNTGLGGMGVMMPQSSSQAAHISGAQQPQPQQMLGGQAQAQGQVTQTQGKDPFADLVGLF